MSNAELYTEPAIARARDIHKKTADQESQEGSVSSKEYDVSALLDEGFNIKAPDHLPNRLTNYGQRLIGNYDLNNDAPTLTPATVKRGVLDLADEVNEISGGNPMAMEAATNFVSEVRPRLDYIEENQHQPNLEEALTGVLRATKDYDTQILSMVEAGLDARHPNNAVRAKQRYVDDLLAIGHNKIQDSTYTKEGGIDAQGMSGLATVMTGYAADGALSLQEIKEYVGSVGATDEQLEEAWQVAGQAQQRMNVRNLTGIPESYEQLSKDARYVESAVVVMNALTEGDALFGAAEFLLGDPKEMSADEVIQKGLWMVDAFKSNIPAAISAIKNLNDPAVAQQALYLLEVEESIQEWTWADVGRQVVSSIPDPINVLGFGAGAKVAASAPLKSVLMGMIKKGAQGAAVGTSVGALFGGIHEYAQQDLAVDAKWKDEIDGWEIAKSTARGAAGGAAVGGVLGGAFNRNVGGLAGRWFTRGPKGTPGGAGGARLRPMRQAEQEAYEAANPKPEYDDVGRALWEEVKGKTQRELVDWLWEIRNTNTIAAKVPARQEFGLDTAKHEFALNPVDNPNPQPGDIRFLDRTLAADEAREAERAYTEAVRREKANEEFVKHHAELRQEIIEANKKRTIVPSDDLDRRRRTAAIVQAHKDREREDAAKELYREQSHIDKYDSRAGAINPTAEKHRAQNDTLAEMENRDALSDVESRVIPSDSPRQSYIPTPRPDEVLYHGRNGPLKLDQGRALWLTRDVEAAEQFKKQSWKQNAEHAEGTVAEYKVDIRYPARRKDLEDLANDFRAGKMADFEEPEKLAEFTDKYGDLLAPGNEIQMLHLEEIREELYQRGFDGFVGNDYIVKPGPEGQSMHEVIVAFDPAQVKAHMSTAPNKVPLPNRVYDMDELIDIYKAQMDEWGVGPDGGDAMDQLHYQNQEQANPDRSEWLLRFSHLWNKAVVNEPEALRAKLPRMEFSTRNTHAVVDGARIKVDPQNPFGYLEQYPTLGRVDDAGEYSFIRDEDFAASEYFSPKALADAYEWASTSTNKNIMYISPNQFLKLTTRQAWMDTFPMSGKTEGIRTVMRDHRDATVYGPGPINSVPELKIQNRPHDIDGKVSFVDAHEGRHRMSLLQEEGQGDMMVPVRVENWGTTSIDHLTRIMGESDIVSTGAAGIPMELPNKKYINRPKIWKSEAPAGPPIVRDASIPDYAPGTYLRPENPIDIGETLFPEGPTSVDARTFGDWLYLNMQEATPRRAEFIDQAQNHADRLGYDAVWKDLVKENPKIGAEVMEHFHGGEHDISTGPYQRRDWGTPTERDMLDFIINAWPSRISNLYE